VSSRISSFLAVQIRILAQINIDGPQATVPPPSPSCPGATFQWELGSPYRTYPFTIHDPISRFKLGYTLLSIDSADSTIRVRSLHCSGSSSTTSGSCVSCKNTSSHIQTTRDHARRLPARIDCSVMSHEQLKQKLGGVEISLKKETLKVRSIVSG
jgi:hypothetical protein